MIKELTRDFKLLRRMNWVMVVVVGLLLTVGIFFIHSACHVSDARPERSLYLRQMVWGCAGIAGYLFFALLDYKHWRKFSWWFYIFSLGLLVLVLLPGVGSQMGRESNRWLVLFGLTIQPSELAKLSVIIMMAAVMSQPGTDVSSLKSLCVLAAVVLIPFFLIAVEPDLGTAMVFVPTAFIIIFAGGVSMKIIMTIVCTGLTALALVLGVFLVPEKMDMEESKRQELYSHMKLRPHQVKRILVFLGIENDPRGAGYNKKQAAIAVGSGAVWGKGYKKGTQKMLGFLPRSVAPTDFIYTVIAEEKGFFGSVMILMLFSLMFLFGLQAALMARDKLGRVICVGIVAMIFSHVFINIAMTVGLLPITGLPLPLLSYGGSFMVMMMSALGVIQSVYIRSRTVKTF